MFAEEFLTLGNASKAKARFLECTLPGYCYRWFHNHVLFIPKAVLSRFFIPETTYETASATFSWLYRATWRGPSSSSPFPTM